jgi:hypothetical protein
LIWQALYELSAGNYIGEMGLHVGMHISTPLTASATVTVQRSAQPGAADRSSSATSSSNSSMPVPVTNLSVTESGAMYSPPYAPPKVPSNADSPSPCQSSSAAPSAGASAPAASAASNKGGLRCLVWSRAHLMDLLEQNPTLQHSIQASITADLVRKLKVSSMKESKAGRGNGADHHSDAQTILEKSNLEYSNLMRYVLDKGVVMPRERNILARFRSIHLIDDEHHLALLESFHWHPLEFERGLKLTDAELQAALGRQARGLPPFPERPEKIKSKHDHPFALR